MIVRTYRLFTAILAIIVIACLFGVQGQFPEQYVTPSGGYSAAAPSVAQNPMQYSQFYTMTPGTAPSNPIGAPQRFAIAGNMPSTVYLGEQMQPVPYSQYQSSPAIRSQLPMDKRSNILDTVRCSSPGSDSITLCNLSHRGQWFPHICEFRSTRH